ncbi:hypothetical protein NDU88_003225 [Pleurodeles waltl]|uniref:Uncharacterized protein n=1 Tax=Pleurodeles waltl TaxID=8319 RepID=A0AAV7SFC8_PLEWA|nr:hypothetical protein NDU88_003225 [Pleurodeles waltl]
MAPLAGRVVAGDGASARPRFRAGWGPAAAGGGQAGLACAWPVALEARQNFGAGCAPTGIRRGSGCCTPAGVGWRRGDARGPALRLQRAGAHASAAPWPCDIRPLWPCGLAQYGAPPLLAPAGSACRGLSGCGDFGWGGSPRADDRVEPSCCGGIWARPNGQAGRTLDSLMGVSKGGPSGQPHRRPGRAEGPFLNFALCILHFGTFLELVATFLRLRRPALVFTLCLLLVRRWAANIEGARRL